ncbi:hypothetical protein [Amycolatopsis sp. NPDC004378]
MTTDTGTAGQASELRDPLCALLAAASPEQAAVLLPAAVARAADLAAQMRETIALHRRATDPLLAALVAALEPATAAHEEFVATWADTDMLSGLTQDMLETDVHKLMLAIASVIKGLVDAARPTA